MVVYWIFMEWIIYLEYKNWKYELTSNHLKIQNGVISKNYRSVPYQRIQNIEIRRGVLARIFGFSVLNIQTAGYSMQANQNYESEGYLPTISKENAEEIKNFILKKLDKK